MIFYRDFYAGESIARKKEKVKWKILHRAGQVDVYVITLSSNPENLMDIIPSWQLMQKYYRSQDMLVIGVDRGYENAMELAGRIVMDVYGKTGGFHVRDYFLKRQEGKLPKKGPRWESYS